MGNSWGSTVGSSSTTAKAAASKGEKRPPPQAPPEPPAASTGGAVGRAERPLTVDEALVVLSALKQAAGAESVQKLMRRAEAMHPYRGVREHPDQQAFVAQVQGLLTHVFRAVLPQKPWCLPPGWEGWQQLNQRMASVAQDPRVVEAKADLNKALGLSRNAVLVAPAEEPLLTFVPDGSGAVPPYDRKLLRDADGDAAHEFWEESNGVLRQTHPAL